jgi:hypothetical protein
MSRRWLQRATEILAIFMSTILVAGSGPWMSGPAPRDMAVHAAELNAPAQTSLQLNGTTAYGEVANSLDLNPSGDWTVELWFRDDDPNGFDHDFREVLNKGDGVAPEAPYYLLIGNGSVLVGAGSLGINHRLSYYLHTAGYSARIW